tara:strand:+ start:631 stop:774 length:144 start_codon:yes stop_codon:yes gene_type:complete
VIIYKKSLCPKEFQKRDIKRDELLLQYHNLAIIVKYATYGKKGRKTK